MADDPDRAPSDPGAGPADTSPGSDSGIESSLPSTTARLLAFAAIVVAGVCGGLIGYGVTNMQCTTHCGGAKAGGGALIGALFVAGGVAVVAVLVLRAMAEWRIIERTGDPAAARTAEKSRRL